jgi:hypothetical protein
MDFLSLSTALHSCQDILSEKEQWTFLQRQEVLLSPKHTVIRIGRIIVYCTNGNQRKEQLPGDNRVKQGFN